MNPNFSFQIYASTKQLPIEWDTIACKNIFLTTAYLRVLETSAPNNMYCHFIGLYKSNELVGVALSQFINLSEVSSFGERDHCIKTAIRNFVFKNVSSKVLVIGNNMLTGQNGFCFRESITHEIALSLLEKASHSLRQLFLEKGLKTQLTIFKDFSESALPYFETQEFSSYFKFSTQPNMLFDIRDSWHHFDEYIAALSKKYRDQYKRARKKSADIHKRKLSLDEIEKYKTRIFELYMNVAKNAPFNTFYLTENHFEVFKSCLKDNFLFYGYFIDDTLIGFNTLIKNGVDIDTYFLGYDEQYQREKMLYLNMLYDMIAYSINKGYKRIVFARTALEIKSSVGATPANMLGLMKHSNPIINLFVSKAFRYFEPEMQWQQRNPFKEAN
ncbi:putative N-acyltransferase [Flavobacterium sp. 7E]|uniref:GNAT family N-acetyltransferase n=1 Tax=Flavobacterium sp. 7E TaxID=2735898 RepID=UPI001571264E|nr:GNAT family N-acetyltransferase [Flavobacterium sp. 7E]NRS90016.1 putative N-acyltransferase [Flavobacterium sp. 7E]